MRDLRKASTSRFLPDSLYALAVAFIFSRLAARHFADAARTLSGLFIAHARFRRLAASSSLIIFLARFS